VKSEERDGIVFDTNVHVSAVLKPGSTAARAVAIGIEFYVPLLSAETATELADVFSREKFDRHITQAQRERYLRDFLPSCRFLTVTSRVSACRDPRDDKFLALAQAGRASAIVTGDDDLLAMRAWEGIPVLSPAEFLRFGPDPE
jgi:putative PIN family toxin of toxin-antitoxin system